MNSYFRSRIKSFGYAFKGIAGLIRSEANFRIHLVLMSAVILLGFVLGITATEWLFQILAFGLVLGGEAMNSGLEKLADATHPEQNPKIGKAKDFAAAAVLLASLAAVAIGLVIYLPYIFAVFGG